MKKLIATLSLALVVVLGSVGFAACKKTTSVVGTWKYDTVEFTTNRQMTAEEKQEIIDELIINVYKSVSFEFKKDNNGAVVNNQNEGNDALNFTWKQDGNNITINGLDELQINKLTIEKGKLVLSMTDADLGEDAQDQKNTFGDKFSIKIFFKK